MALTTSGAMVRKLFLVDHIRDVNELAKLTSLKPDTVRKHLNDITKEIEKKCQVITPNASLSIDLAKITNEVRFQRETNEKELNKVCKSLKDMDVGSREYDKLVRLKIALEGQLNKLNGVDLALKLQEKKSMQELESGDMIGCGEDGMKDKGKAIEVPGF